MEELHDNHSPTRSRRTLVTLGGALVVGAAVAVICAALLKLDLFYVLLALAAGIAFGAAFYVYARRVNRRLREAAERSRLHLATVEALATAIDAKDQTTHCHVRRLQIYATGMGRLLKLSRREIEALESGSLLHDIGKLAIPGHILNEPGKLSAAEFEKMKLHTVVGAQILERVAFPFPVVPVVRHHHERWDGKGYPDGLRGEDIPLTARILAVVDCYDSAREDRPFRRGMSRAEAVTLLGHGSGTHFDPRLVELFLQHLPAFEREIAASKLDVGLTNGEGEQAPTHSSEIPRAEIIRRTAAPRAGVPPYLEQIKNAQREVYAFYQIARTFGSSIKLEETLALLVGKIGQVAPFEASAVYLLDEATQTATAAHASAMLAEKLRGHTVTPGRGLIGRALAERCALYRSAPEIEIAGAPPEGENSFRSMAVIPLMKNERLLGALALYSATLREYTNEHMRLLDTVARLASDALANALRHAEVEANSLTDALTGLPNSRCMFLHFEGEAARARRANSSFHVIMLDLDDFKQVNDAHGHRVGDRLLREVSRVMKAQLREYDFLARYGGDEFVLIVQGLVNNLAEELCERIEKSVASFSLAVREGGGEARVGLSAGIAIYGQDGDTLEQLLLAADQAMYRVKTEHKKQRGAPPPEKNVEELTTGDLATSAVN
ncbi:MAG TPA: diguanylate cyclase [Pyrinomonadaceae bacterium]|nr:diguanylate cyclase [Pyrinomonadaceae bacterium]